MKIYFPLSLIVILLFQNCQPKPVKDKLNYVVILSMDGFRWDYPEKAPTPALDGMAADGVKAEYMEPTFPTKTFPNHYTLATGMYPGEHGIVANVFYNDSLKALYSMYRREAVRNPKFYGGEPIWGTAEKNSIKSATCFWPGSEAPIKGTLPSYWLAYDGSMSYLARLDTVTYWLNLPYDERPHLLMFYIDEPDHTAHDYGPDNDTTFMKVASVDSFLMAARKRFASLDMADSINFIVLSDHGGTSIDMNKAYKLKDILPEHWVAHQNTSNPVALIDPEEGYADSIVAKLNTLEGVHAWLKKDIPEKYHYKHHPAIPEVVAIADSSYSLYWGIYTLKGDHGYDPATNSDMRNIFYADGPQFKSGYMQAPFSNRLIYPLVKSLLKVDNETDRAKLKENGFDALK